MLSNIVTSNNLQNLSYEYDKFGNLASRKDNLRNQEETFHYDKMNRLTDIYLGTTHSQIVYDPLGHKNQYVMGKHNAYFGDCKSPCSPPADCKSAGTGKSNHTNDRRRA